MCVNSKKYRLCKNSNNIFLALKHLENKNTGLQSTKYGINYPQWGKGQSLEKIIMDQVDIHKGKYIGFNFVP